MRAGMRLALRGHHAPSSACMWVLNDIMQVLHVPGAHAFACLLQRACLQMQALA